MRFPRALGTVLAALGVVLVLLAASVAIQLRLPPVDAPVGRARFVVADTDRPETMTGDPADHRQIPAWLWYPALAGTGRPAPYFPGLSDVAADLAASGEVAPVEVAGLRLVRSPVRLDAEADPNGAPYPVVLLLPGNGTNVEFYHALSARLASRGYVVVGLNHPYDVAAVALRDGTVARFAASTWGLDPDLREAFVERRIVERARDVLAVMDRLASLEGLPSALGGMLDLSRVALVGHSLGALAAAEVARGDPTIRAWVNLDGQQRGGPFSTDPAVGPPDQPFLFVTKEKDLHPLMRERMAAIAGPSWRVVLDGATHDSFTDGPLLVPSLLPLPNRADRIADLIGSYVAEFLDLVLRGAAGPLLAPGATPPAGVTVESWPAP